MQVLSIQPTPNPTAFKFVVDETMQTEGSRYYNNATEAAKDSLATELFALKDVQTVYFAEDFATVTSTDGADLDALHQQVQKVLETHASGGSPVAGGAPAAAASVTVTSDDGAMLDSINELLDERVRPALAGDGGGLQILALENKVLRIRYEGACGSCPSSISGTLNAIQNLLQMEVDEELTVVNG